MNRNETSGTKENPGRDRIYDLAVVGAGPAGSLAAALAVKAGFSTVILEQKRLPRLKICGGFISARCLSLLPDDLILPPESFEPAYTISVTRGKINYSHTAKTRLGLITKREHFDYFLAGYARDKGAVLIQEFALNGLEKEKESRPGSFHYLLQGKRDGGSIIRSRYVIGADGALGRCGLLSGLRKSINAGTGWGLARIVEVEPGSAKPGVLNFYPLPFLGGMGWSFIGPGWVNQGVGGLARRRYLQRAYQHLFPESIKSSGPPAWPLPFLGPLQNVAAENLLLVGDAAGLIEPFSGEGLFNSLKSSILAVEALVRAEEEKTGAATFYRESVHKYFRKNFAASLTGAALLHARAVVLPSSLPQSITALMENRLWFNRSPANPFFE